MPMWTCPNCKTPHVVSDARLGIRASCPKCNAIRILTADAKSPDASREPESDATLHPIKGSGVLDALRILCIFSGVLGLVLALFGFIILATNPIGVLFIFWGFIATVMAGLFALLLEALNDIHKSRKLLERISEQLRSRH